MKTIEAFFDDFNDITLNLLNIDYKNVNKVFKIYDEEKNVYIDTKVFLISSDEYYTYLTLKFDYDIEVGKKYYIIDENRFSTIIQYRLITHSKRFDNLYYTDEQLGVIYNKNKSIFKLWAPTSYKVILNINNEYIPMKRTSNGIYKIEINRDCLNDKYLYLVDVNGQINETIDPYARMSGPNGAYSIVTYNKKVEKLHEVKTHDSIYELSVYDYSAKHSFNSLKERIPYLKSLNISTIQLMPSLDFGSVDELNKDMFYNWGYDPSQFFAFEGLYSEKPIDDFKSLIEEFHKYDLNVTLDVVFNHVFNSDNFSLNLVVPYYFFNYDNYPNIKLTKYSGCQNDFRSTGKMCYKFYYDVLKYQIEYFNLDGVRLDLMGLLDLDTVKKLEYDLKQIKPSFIIYGEGWNMNFRMNGAITEKARKVPNIGFFNDYFRDNLIDLLKGDSTKWYYFIDTMKGNHALDFDNPSQSINYIECHDGYTFYDNILNSVNKNYVKNICDLGMAFVTLSQGIPFFSEGQETYRTKKGNSNSYNLNNGLNIIKDFKNDNILSKLMYIRKKYKDCFLSSYEEINKYVKIISKDNCICYYCKYLKIIFNYSYNEIDLVDDFEILLNTSSKENKLEPFTFIIYKTY